MKVPIAAVRSATLRQMLRRNLGSGAKELMPQTGWPADDAATYRQEVEPPLTVSVLRTVFLPGWRDRLTPPVTPT